MISNPSCSRRPGCWRSLDAAQDSFRLVLDMQDEHDGDASGFADAALLAVDPDDVAASVVLDPVAVNDSIFWNTMSSRAQSSRGPGRCGANLLFLTYGDPSRFRPRRSRVRTASIVSNITSRSAGVSRSDASQAY